MKEANNPSGKLLWTILGEQFWSIYIIISCIALMKSMDLKTLLWIFYGFVISISIKKVIAVFAVKEERWRFSDPLYLILMVITVGVCIGAFKDYDFRLAFLISTGLIAVINFTLLRFTDSDYNPDKSARNAFKVAKKCPHCFSSLPSYFTSKCPHCTAEL